MVLSLRGKAESDKRYFLMKSRGNFGPHDLSKVYVDSMPLNTRSRNTLNNLNIHSLADLSQTDEREIELALNSGGKTLRQIKREMKKLGLILNKPKIKKPRLIRKFKQFREEYTLGSIYDRVRNVFGPHDFSKVSIYQLGLKKVSEAVLEKRGIVSLADILESNEKYLIKKRAINKEIVLETREALNKLGLNFRKKSDNNTNRLMRRKNYNGPFELNYVPLIDVGFEPRTYQVLKSLKMYSLADLVSSNEKKVLFGRNCGIITLNKIKEKLANIGFYLGGQNE